MERIESPQCTRLNGLQGGGAGGGSHCFLFRGNAAGIELLAVLVLPLPAGDFSLWVPMVKQQSDDRNRQNISPLAPSSGPLASEELTFHCRVVELLFRVCWGTVSAPALSLCCKLNPPQFTPPWVLHGKGAVSPTFPEADT